MKLIFKTTDKGGSFGTVPTNGTVPTPGSGVQATTLFNTDGTELASNGPSGSNWPAWLSSVEVGVSGTANTASTNPDCARFATSTEATLTNCQVGSSTSNAAKCGAPEGIFRVSEADCSLGSNPTTTGTGGANDGVYIRAVFSRDTANLALTENVLVVLEYIASALNPAPSNPASCFSSSDGSLSPESCSDFVWRIYLKHSTTESVQPFLLLVPPIFSSILPFGNSSLPTRSGLGITTKQFVIPLAGDSTLSVLQISRVKSNFSSTSELKQYCAFDSAAPTTGTLPGDSPLCAGMIFYSISFYRI